MTATLTATPDTSGTPRVHLVVAGMAGATVTITRTDTAGTAPVRTANPGTLVAGGFAVYDYEAQYGVTITYTATSDTADTATATTTLTVVEPWLIHPGDTTLSIPIEVGKRGDLTYATNTATHLILGRSTPIVISDGVRKQATFPLTVNTRTLADEQALLKVLADASPLLLQIAYSGVSRAENWWVSVGEVTAVNVVDTYFGSTFTQWTLPCTVTSIPTGSQQAPWTWAGVTAGYATWAAVTAAFATWNDLTNDSP